MGIKSLLFFLVIFMSFSSPVLAENWLEYKTDNFLVYSNGKRETVESLVTELEYYRYYLQIVTNVKATKSKIPLKIYAMRNNPSFKSLTGFGGGTLGFYWTHPRTGVTFLELEYNFGEGSRLETQPGRQILFHEYSHYFVRQFTSFNYPRWFNEGFAEYLGAFSYKDGTGVVGQVVPGRALTLGSGSWLPLEQIFASNTFWSPKITRKGMVYFGYAQSWFLVHYLQHNKKYKGALAGYLTDINAGADYKEAYDKNFPITMKALGKELKAYWKKGKMPYLQLTFESIDFHPKVEIRKLTEDETEIERAKAKALLYFDEGRVFARRKVLKKAISTSSEPFTIKVLLAEMELHVGNYDEARKIIEGVLERAPDTEGAKAVYGGVLVEQASEMATGEERVALFLKARQYLRQATREEPLNNLGHFYLGSSYVYGPEGDWVEGENALVISLGLLPQLDATWLELALLDARMGNLEMAQKQFTKLAKWNFGVIKKTANYCLEEIKEKGADHGCVFENLKQFEDDD